ncbi:MAG: VOC family protein, partial [Candidatus Promineifilaceae bacterium]
HHFTLTVNDLQRSVDFYTKVLGFEQVADLGTAIALHNGSFLMVVAIPPEPDQALADDRFNENRVGLDHVSFLVESHDAMEKAAAALDAMGVSRGAIRDLGKGFGIYVMAFRDPDNIQLELTALYD